MNDKKNFLIASMCCSAMYPYINYQAKTIKKYDPDADYIIWDVGLKEEQKDELSKHARVVDYTTVDEGCFDKILEKYRKSPEKDNEDPLKVVVMEAGFKKPFCMKGCVDAGYEEFLFLDADAFLCAYPRDIFKEDFNVGVTLRPKQKQKLNKDNIVYPPKFEGNLRVWRDLLLNSGVLMFKGGQIKLNRFLNTWIFDYIFKNPVTSDQGNLNYLIDKCDGWDWESAPGIFNLEIKNSNILVNILHCDKYNWFVKKDAVIPDGVIVAHCKGSDKRRHKIDTIEDYKDWIGIQANNYVC